MGAVKVKMIDSEKELPKMAAKFIEVSEKLAIMLKEHQATQLQIQALNTEKTKITTKVGQMLGDEVVKKLVLSGDSIVLFQKTGVGAGVYTTYFPKSDLIGLEKPEVTK